MVPVIDRLRNLPGITLGTPEPQTHNGTGSDALLSLSSAAGTHRYAAAYKPTVTTNTLPSVLAQLQRQAEHTGLTPLLLTHHVTPAVAERLMQATTQFADAAGNIYLDSPAAYILVLGKGPTDTQSRGASLTATDIVLLYALLARPDLRRAPYRTLQKATGVSLGKISATIQKLRALDHLAQAPDRSLHIKDFTNLLQRWEYGYHERLRPKLGPTTWRLESQLTLADLHRRATNLEDVLIGGEFAADAYTDHLKPATLTLHVPKGQAPKIAANLRLLPATREAPRVTLLERFPPSDIDRDDATGLVHPILVRAELLALGDDRLREIANRLLDDVIAPRETHA